MKLSDRIATTATVLDRLYPSWYKRINLDTLDMHSCSSCVAGQLAKSYRHVDDDGSRSWLPAYSVFAERFLRKARKSDRTLLGLKNVPRHRIYTEDAAIKIGFGTRGKNSWTREIRARRALDAAKKASAA